MLSGPLISFSKRQKITEFKQQSDYEREYLQTEQEQKKELMLDNLSAEGSEALNEE